MLLQVETVEEAPTTVAALIHVVAIQAVLGGQFQGLAEPNPDSRLEHRVAGEQVARTAATLVVHFGREVVPLHVLPVPLVWDLTDVDAIEVTIEEELGLTERIPEFLRILAESFCGMFGGRLGQPWRAL